VLRQLSVDGVSIELRQYEPKLVASVLYTGNDRASENMAFETLAKYICGFNKRCNGVGHDEIAMTSPVRVAAAHDEIAMTSPVATLWTTRLLAWRAFAACHWAPT
jgi:hypothetical protein